MIPFNRAGSAKTNLKLKTMKTQLMAVLMAIMIAGAANAQHVNIGLKGGLNVYNINNSNNFKFNSKNGFHAGLLGHIHLTKTLGLQPEIVYSTQGAQLNFGNQNTTLNRDYVNVPVLVQYMFAKGFRIQAGPQLGVLVRANSKTNNENSFDNKENFKTLDLAVSVGASYIHPSSFGLDLRYNHGLSNVNNYGTVKSTNRGVQLGVFYLFNHKS
jgi:hypothetical protein